MRIIIVFKNGFQLNITCEKFTIYYQLGIPYGYEASGIEDNKLLYIDWNEVLCVYRDMRGDSDDEGRSNKGAEKSSACI